MKYRHIESRNFSHHKIKAIEQYNIQDENYTTCIFLHWKHYPRLSKKELDNITVCLWKKQPWYRSLWRKWQRAPKIGKPWIAISTLCLLYLTVRFFEVETLLEKFLCSIAIILHSYLLISWLRIIFKSTSRN